MIAVEANVRGVEALNKRLSEVAKRVKNPKQMLGRVATYIHGAFQENMSKGIDPDGKPLTPIARWTRIVGKGAGAGKNRLSGRMIPLLNTGGLRNAMNIWDLSNKGVMIGWKGRYLEVARKQTNGIGGSMRVRENRIKGVYTGLRTNKQGGQYFSVKDGGQWWSRKVTGGVTPVKPRPRKFFYLSRKQIKRAGEIADKFIGKAFK